MNHSARRTSIAALALVLVAPAAAFSTLALAEAAARVARRMPVVVAALVVVFGLLYFAAITGHAIAG